LDQKKIPCFTGDFRKDNIQVREWIRRIESMKNAHNWTEEQTYENAIAALFDRAANIMLTHTSKSVNADFVTTWAWLKKKMLQHFGGLTSETRAITDILAGIKIKTDLRDDMLNHACLIEQDFRKIREALDRPQVPAGGPYTQEQCQVFCDAAADNNLAQIARAMIINTMPPLLRTKILEKNPKTMAETLRYVEEGHRLLLDERRPVGNLQPNQAVHAYYEDPGTFINQFPQDTQTLAQQVEAILNKRPQNNTQQFNSNSNYRKKNNNQSNKVDRSKLKCLYCNKNGHGPINCFKRIDNKDPCYNQKGEPYFPASDEEVRKKRQAQASAVNTCSPSDNESTVNNAPVKEETPITADTTEPSPSKGSVFRSWV